MAAIAMMALALFSCKKKDEPKTEAVLRICINDAELRALEAPVAAGTKTECLKDVVLTMDNGQTITLTDAELADAKDLNKGYKKDITYVVNTVALTANAVIANDTEIKTLQGADLTKVALEAPATAVTTSTDGDKTVYTVTLEPKPVVARLEVGGKIKGQANGAGVNAFEDITVEHVYVNNYLSTRAGDRHMCKTNGKDGFAADPALEDAMNDEILAAKKADFELNKLVAGYQLFPKKTAETATAPEYFDHVILKIKITYTAAAIALDPTLEQKTDRYVTIARFMKENTGDLDGGFLAGVIYKLDLNELSKDFKTGDNGLPDPNNPDTPDPEPNQKKQLIVKVKPYEWTAQNIKPDVTGGYKK